MQNVLPKGQGSISKGQGSIFHHEKCSKQIQIESFLFVCLFLELIVISSRQKFRLYFDTCYGGVTCDESLADSSFFCVGPLYRECLFKTLRWKESPGAEALL